MKNRLEHALRPWKPRKKVSYKGRVWNVKELLVHLVTTVERLSATQCKPRASCLHRYHDYMDKKFVKKEI